MAKPLICKFVTKAAPLSEDARTAPADGANDVEATAGAAATPAAELATEDDAQPQWGS